MKEAILIDGPYEGRRLSVSDNTTRIVMPPVQTRPKVWYSSLDDVPPHLQYPKEVIYNYIGRHVETGVLGFEVEK